MKNALNNVNPENTRFIQVIAPAAVAAGACFVPASSGSVHIAFEAIANGATGTAVVASTSAFTVPKVAGTAWVAGQTLYWDASASAFQATGSGSPATGDIVGAAVCTEAAASAATTGAAILVPGGALT
jgi:predicted RecA/RadA family phage recombinase